MPGLAEQFSDFTSFCQLGDWVSDTRQDEVQESCDTQLVHGLRGPVEGLG